jgi:hypothetical protein
MKILYFVVAVFLLLEYTFEVNAQCWSNGWGCVDNGCNRNGNINMDS